MDCILTRNRRHQSWRAAYLSPTSKRLQRLEGRRVNVWIGVRECQHIGRCSSGYHFPSSCWMSASSSSLLTPRPLSCYICEKRDLFHSLRLSGKEMLKI